MEKKDLPLPVCVDVKAGEIYLWCQCGQSGNLPFCDADNCCGKPVEFQSRFDDTVYFCNCRQSKDPPLCDGSHAELLRAMIKEKRG